MSETVARCRPGWDRQETVRRLDAAHEVDQLAAGAGAVVGAVAAYDVTQKKHAIRRNLPIIGNLRFTLERFGPELRREPGPALKEEVVAMMAALLPEPEMPPTR